MVTCVKGCENFADRRRREYRRGLRCTHGDGFELRRTGHVLAAAEAERLPEVGEAGGGRDRVLPLSVVRRLLYELEEVRPERLRAVKVTRHRQQDLPAVLLALTANS